MGKKNSAEKNLHNQDIGRRGENAAARYLELIGYDILERNWKCSAGEADIVAEVDGVLVFVEVKTRTNIDKGFPSEAVNAKKRAKYERIACWYLRDHDYVDVPVRFDVIALMVVSPDRAMIRHYKGAFDFGC